MTLKQFSLVFFSQWVLWLIFTDSAGVREIIAGAVASMLGGFAVLSFCRCADDRYKLGSKDLLRFLHVPKTIAVDTLIVLRVIALGLFGRPVSGQMVAVHFHTGGNNSSSRGRRGLAITFLTLAPNTVVLGFAQDRKFLVFHELIPQRPPRFIFEMGAAPDHGAGTQQ